MTQKSGRNQNTLKFHQWATAYRFGITTLGFTWLSYQTEKFELQGLHDFHVDPWFPMSDELFPLKFARQCLTIMSRWTDLCGFSPSCIFIVANSRHGLNKFHNIPLTLPCEYRVRLQWKMKGCLHNSTFIIHMFHSEVASSLIWANYDCTTLEMR